MQLHWWCLKQLMQTPAMRSCTKMHANILNVVKSAKRSTLIIQHLNAFQILKSPIAILAIASSLALDVETDFFFVQTNQPYMVNLVIIMIILLGLLIKFCCIHCSIFFTPMSFTFWLIIGSSVLIKSVVKSVLIGSINAKTQ